MKGFTKELKQLKDYSEKVGEARERLRILNIIEDVNLIFDESDIDITKVTNYLKDKISIKAISQLGLTKR